jgi:hypothetical protein
VSAFDKKLSEVSKPIPHGLDLATLRNEVMDRGMAKPASKPVVNPVKMTPDEIKREVSMKELTGTVAPVAKTLIEKPHIMAKPVETPRVVVAPKPSPPPVMQRPVDLPISRPPLLASLASITMVDDLKKIELINLRQGTPRDQIEVIKSKILSLIHANRILPYYAVNAFEQSPLFAAYLAHGQAKFSGVPAVNDLSQAEFEAVADLRKEIEKL